MFKDTIFQFCAYKKRFDERLVCNGLEGERVAFREGHLSISRVRGKIRVRESGRAILRFRACEERFGGENRVQGGGYWGTKAVGAQWETRKRRGTEAEEKREGCEERKGGGG